MQNNEKKSLCEQPLGTMRRLAFLQPPGRLVQSNWPSHTSLIYHGVWKQARLPWPLGGGWQHPLLAGPSAAAGAGENSRSAVVGSMAIKRAWGYGASVCDRNPC